MKKFIGLIIALIGFSTTSLLGQSPAPATSPEASPAKKHSKKKEAATAPATTASSTSTTAASSPAPAKRSGKKETAAPAPGAAPGLVWVNSETHVYHKAGSRWYGTTKNGKYMAEQAAIQEGDRPAKDEAKKQ